MSYLRNAWYAAGWGKDLGVAPLARTFLDEPVVLYRDEAGSPAALYDTCPHRFAPLSLGKVIDGGRIACPYHGLQFDRTGRCVHNPHGKGLTPPALSVKSYPVVERYGMLWIWMGAAAQADETLIPSFPPFEAEGFSWVYGQLEVSANYLLVIDNLLDLSHVEYLHPFLSSPGNAARTSFRAEHEGNTVSACYDIVNEPITALFRLLWEGDDERGNMRAYMHWSAPSNLYLDTRMSALEDDPEHGAILPTFHLLTPKTEDSVHYFWAAGRNRRHGDETVSAMLYEGTQNAFEREDEPIIRAVRSRMKSNDLFAHRPALLPNDEAAVRARRVLKKLIDAENAAA